MIVVFFFPAHLNSHTRILVDRNDYSKIVKYNPQTHCDKRKLHRFITKTMLNVRIVKLSIRLDYRTPQNRKNTWPYLNWPDN